MGRNLMTVEGRKFWFGWDNPTQTFFLDEENPMKDPCENCDKGFNSGMCPDMCYGHNYEELIAHYGPMTGKMVRTPGAFIVILENDFGFDGEASAMMRSAIAKEWDKRRTPSPLQQRVSKVFASIQQEVA